MTAGTWVKWRGADERLRVGRFLAYLDEHREHASVEHREFEAPGKLGRAHPVTVPVARLSEWSRPPMPDAAWAS